MNIMIIGSTGYTGSKLYTHLTQLGHNITGIDLNWFGNPADLPHTEQDFATVTAEQYVDQDAVIVLAGHNSVNMCQNDLFSCYNNNVRNFIRMLSHIDDQLVIYASSSSVYGNHNTHLAKESDSLCQPLNAYDCTKQMIDRFAQTSTKNCIGLRFGTVCGPSVNFRKDVMINAMTYNALTEGKVKVFNGDTRRSILCISDLCRAIQTVLEHGYQGNTIYNLASFHSTAIELGESVAKVCDVQLVNADVEDSFNEKMCQKTYDFHADSTLFEHDYNFKFTATPESITHNVIEALQANTLVPTHRNVDKHYE